MIARAHLQGMPFRVGLGTIIFVGNFLYQLQAVAYLLFRHFCSLLGNHLLMFHTGC